MKRKKKSSSTSNSYKNYLRLIWTKEVKGLYGEDANAWIIKLKEDSQIVGRHDMYTG